MDELKRARNSAFNWSDEELLGEDLTDIIYKDKYSKKAKKKSVNAYSQLKDRVHRGYSQAKAGLAGKTPASQQEPRSG